MTQSQSQSQNQPPSIPPCQGGGFQNSSLETFSLLAGSLGLAPSPDKGRAGEGFAFLPYNQNLTERARENRKNPTKAESKIWREILRMKQFADFKFLRQKPIDNYIVDFYCSELRLVIEVDGDSHVESVEYDALRTSILESLGLRVIRFTNADVLGNIEGVYEELIKVTQTGSCHPSEHRRSPLNNAPLPQSG
jgi:very-short-patch-repair endonuclease